MLGDAVLTTMIPVANVDRARRFYGETLGLREIEADPFSATFEAGGGTRLTAYRRTGSTSDHALASFRVRNLARIVADLGRRGVSFEDYDTPAIRTVNSIAEDGPTRHAWFRDPDGNLLELVERGRTASMG
jgi:catechol 2,3-dioxygenase-like lactoylglutathione lyase family enzyme